MSKTKNEKKQLVKKYEEMLGGVKAFYVITPTKITPNEATSLRKKLTGTATFNVVKNALFRLALKNTKKELSNVALEGENAVVFVEGEATEGAKAVYDFVDEIEKGEIKGGMLDGQELSKDDVVELAKLPSKDVMLGQVVGTIAAPVSGFVNVLNANLTGFVSVLKNISDSKEQD